MVAQSQGDYGEALSRLYQSHSDEALLLEWAEAQEIKREAIDTMGRIEYELQHRMTERGATAILDPFFECKLETPATLDAELLRPLAEHIPPDEWTRGFTEAHQETVDVPARADLRTVKSWAKYGAEVAALIERAKVPGTPRVKITPKKG